MTALAQACRQFEGVVLQQVLESAGFGRIARTGADSGEDDPAGGAEQDGVFQSLVVESLADALARSGGVGLARELERALASARS